MSTELEMTSDVAPPPVSRRTSLLLDAVERLFVLALYAWLIVRLATAYQANGGLGNLFLLVSEGLLVVFLLIRRRAVAVSHRPSEWLLAMAATCAPLLVAPTGGNAWLAAPAATVMLCGMLVQLHAKMTLARSFGMVPANRGVKTRGPYRFVRHPMYAGYLITHVGFLVMNPSLWNLGLYSLCLGLQIPRLLAEERLLRRDPIYRNYQSRVAYHIFPGIY